MRIFWSQGNLAFQPESVKECGVLKGLVESLKTAQFTEPPLPEFGMGLNFPDWDTRNKNAVTSFNVFERQATGLAEVR